MPCHRNFTGAVTGPIPYPLLKRVWFQLAIPLIDQPVSGRPSFDIICVLSVYASGSIMRPDRSCLGLYDRVFPREFANSIAAAPCDNA